MITNPSDRMISNAQLMGWEYMGGGYFEKDNFIGYFTEDGWVKE